MLLKNKIICLIPMLLLLSCSSLRNRPDKAAGIITKKERDLKPNSNKSSDTTSNGLKAYSDLISKDAINIPGLLIVHKVKDKFYLEIKDSILKRDLLIVNRIVKGASETTRPMFGNLGFAGDEIGENVVQFNKGPQNKIFLQRMSYLEVSKDSSANGVFKGVNNSNFPPIVASFDIKALSNDSTGYLIDVTDYLKGDNDVFYFNADIKTALGIGAFQGDKSFILQIKSFPQNTEIRTIKTYIKGATFNTYELNSSIVLLPKTLMHPRYSDSRIGYFSVDYKNFDDPEGVSDNAVITRWRLEPKDEDTDRYKKGELVEPKHPIVYYIDPAFPKKWVPYLIQGVNDWQKAFEKAGFKHAIYALEAPTNDSTWSMEDARHNVIVFKPSAEANASGPNVHDPRTGEIIETHINWYHNVIQLVHDWYMIQAGPSDPRGRKMVFDDQLMGRLIRFVICHEVGHTLGLTHNFIASSTVPVDSLRSKSYLDSNGICPSIMDYARFNYVAQPKDSVPEEDLIGRIGVYDKWAIEWGYKWITKYRTEKEEKSFLNKWVISRIEKDKRLSYGTHDAAHPTFDPRNQSEDLGDDAMKASRYGIANLKFDMANLLRWTKDSDADYRITQRIQNQIITQYNRYLGHVDGNVAGIIVNPITGAQKGVVYDFSTREKQRKAVKFFQDELFTTPTWLIDKGLYPYTSYGGIFLPLSLQKNILYSLMSATNFENLSLFAAIYPEKAYTYDELLTDLEEGIWKELEHGKPIDVYRRDLQKAYVEKLINVFQINTASLLDFTQSPTKVHTDMFSIAKKHVRNLIWKINTAIPHYKGLAKEHLIDIKGRLNNSLNIQKVVQVKEEKIKADYDLVNDDLLMEWE